MRYHYMKLLRMMVPGFVAFTIVDAITPGPFHFKAGDVVAQLLMVINLLPHPDKIIWPGPYWFFGLMMQLYVAYRLALRRHWGWAVALVAACWAAQAVCQPTGEALNRLRYNCVGGMLVFCAGLLAARHLPAARLLAASRGAWATTAVAATAVALACCASFQAWLWAPLAVVAAAVGAVKRTACPGAAPAVVARGHIGCHVRSPPAAAQGVHPHVAAGRRIRRAAALRHSHGGRVVDVHGHHRPHTEAQAVTGRCKIFSGAGQPGATPSATAHCAAGPAARRNRPSGATKRAATGRETGRPAGQGGTHGPHRHIM